MFSIFFSKLFSGAWRECNIWVYALLTHVSDSMNKTIQYSIDMSIECFIFDCMWNVNRQCLLRRKVTNKIPNDCHFCVCVRAVTIVLTSTTREWEERILLVTQCDGQCSHFNHSDNEQNHRSYAWACMQSRVKATENWFSHKLNDRRSWGNTRTKKSNKNLNKWQRHMKPSNQ